MKKITWISCLICLAFIANASTSITTANVSGHWTLAGSPYNIYNNITLNPGDSLTIDPGVEIIFQGYYLMTVYGAFYSAGTAALPVSYHVNDTTGWSDTTTGTGGWEGIAIYPYSNSMPDRSAFSFCNVSDLKGQPMSLYRAMMMSNCSFFHNKSGAIQVSADSSLPTGLMNCNFYNNYGQITISLASYSSSSGIIQLHRNNIYQNNAGVSIIYCAYANLLIDSNKMYQDTGSASILEMFNCYSVIRNNMVYENTTMQDAAIASSQSITDINGNYICNNSAVNAGITSDCAHIQGGAAIRIDDESDPAPSSNLIHNNIIANNYTAYYGAGVYVIGANATIYNNQILNNTAMQGGIFAFGQAGNKLIIKNNILYNNVSTNYGINDSMNVHLGTVDSLVYENNWTQHTFSQDVFSEFGPSSAPLLSGDTATNIIGTDPGLVAPTTTANVSESALGANFALLATSPCINKGNNTGIPYCYYDYAGNDRVFGSAIDIGAYEYGASPFALGTVQTIAEETMDVYPNPAGNTVIISTPEAKGHIRILDMTGRKVAEKEANSRLTYFDVHDLSRGMYFVIWNDGNSREAVQKVVME